MASPERDTWFMDWGLAVYFSSILRKQLCSNPNFYYDISLLVNLGTRSNKYELSYYYWALLAKEKKKKLNSYVNNDIQWNKENGP